MLSAMLNVVISVKSPLGIATATVLLLENYLQLIKDFFKKYFFLFRSRVTNKATWSNSFP